MTIKPQRLLHLRHRTLMRRKFKKEKLMARKNILIPQVENGLVKESWKNYKKQERMRKKLLLKLLKKLRKRKIRKQREEELLKQKRLKLEVMKNWIHLSILKIERTFYKISEITVKIHIHISSKEIWLYHNSEKNTSKCQLKRVNSWKMRQLL